MWRLTTTKRRIHDVRRLGFFGIFAVVSSKVPIENKNKITSGKRPVVRTRGTAACGLGAEHTWRATNNFWCTSIQLPVFLFLLSVAFSCCFIFHFFVWLHEAFTFILTCEILCMAPLAYFIGKPLILTHACFLFFLNFIHVTCHLCSSLLPLFRITSIFVHVALTSGQRVLSFISHRWTLMPRFGVRLNN